MRIGITGTLNTSDIAFLASEKAIKDAGIDKEEIDYIILAHNFGDVAYGQSQSDMLPSLATRVKHHLRIKNPRCVAYDMLFGCPGWIESVIQANAFIKSGLAKKCLVIGAETLSRIVDPYDRDSMIYSDGAGAAIIEADASTGEILAHATATYTYDEAYFLFYGTIVKRFYALYNKEMPEGVMPMIIEKLGNSSVATVPTLLDLIRKGKIENQELKKGDVVIFASVGAGMNVNAIVYRM